MANTTWNVLVNMKFQKDSSSASPGTAAVAKEVKDSVKEVEASVVDLSRVTSIAQSALAGFGISLTAAFAVREIKAGLESLISTAVDFSATVEKNTLSLAALIETFTRTSTEAIPSYSQAIGVATDLQTQLQISALQTGFKFEDL